MSAVREQAKPIDRARAYIAKMDAAVERAGGDKQTFEVCCRLVNFGLSASEAMTVLGEYNLRCQPPWSELGLSRKLRAAFSKTGPDSKFTEVTESKFDLPASKAEPAWPKMSGVGRAKIIAETNLGLADLWEESPIRPEKPACDEWIDLLFPGDPLLCVGRRMDIFQTAPRSKLRGKLSSMALIVPSTMSALTGKIQDPEPDGPTESAHTKDNTGPRRFAVVECDTGPLDEHAAILWHLRNWAPLVMVVFSGKKSLHGWFYVEDQPEEKVRRFYRYATSLGADRATYLKSQFVRVPDGTRDTGEFQAVYYFNPNNFL